MALVPETTAKTILAVILIGFSMQDDTFADDQRRTPQASESDTLVGINYFAGWWEQLPNKWHGWSVDDPDWRLEFPERVPLLGEYNTQATMDREIAAAADHGVDFFAILWYFPRPGTPETKNAPLLNRGLETFLASPNAGRMKFFIEHCNAPNFATSSEAQWETCVKTWVDAMKHPSYFRVDGRLVFKVHSSDNFYRTHGSNLELCRKRLASLRAAVRDAGLGEVIIGCGIMGMGPTMGPDWPQAQLFDFSSTYMSQPETKPREKAYPYEKLAETARLSRKRRASDPIPWMPFVSSGWNPRPWTYPKGPPHYRRFFEFPTREEFSNELKVVQEAFMKHPSLGLPRRDGSTQKAFTIYAWNEFGEGGIVAPTKGKGYMMLECIREAFDADSSSAKDKGG